MKDSEKDRPGRSGPRRLDPGGFAYGETPYPLELGGHRDAPLSDRGRVIWTTTVTLIVFLGIALLFYLAVS